LYRPDVLYFTTLSSNMPITERQQIAEEKKVAKKLHTPHHPYLDFLRPMFDPLSYRIFLNETEVYCGSLRSYENSPLADQDVINQTEDVLSQAGEYLTPEDLCFVRKAAYFSIWAHGTNPRVEKRFRHELKPGSKEHKPYAIHSVRTVGRLLGFDALTLAGAFLHDVPEDTPYTQADIERFFGQKTAVLTRRVEKISTDQLTDIDSVELSVAGAYLKQFTGSDKARYAVALIERQPQYLLDGPISAYENLLQYYPQATDKKPVSAVIKEYTSTPHDAQVLTVLRLMSVIGRQDEARALVIKCADVADNMQSIAALAQAKSPKRAEGKAVLALNFFAPLAEVLGLREIAREIEECSFPIVYPRKAKHLNERIKSGGIGDEQIREIEQRFAELKTYYVRWANSHFRYSIDESAINVLIRNPTFAEVERYRIQISAGHPLSPIVEIHAVDGRIAAEFENFLSHDFRGGSADKLSVRRIEQEDGGGKKQVQFKIVYGNYLHNLSGFIYDDSGDIADVYRVKHGIQAFFNGQTKMQLLARSYHSGDYGDFLDRLGTGGKVVTFTHPDSNYGFPRKMFIPGDATLLDAVLINGLDPNRLKMTVVRGGKRVDGFNIDLLSGDVVEVSEVNNRETINFDWFDVLRIPQAAKKYQQIIISRMLTDWAVSETEIEEFKEHAIKRGIRIISLMADTFLSEREYGDSRWELRDPINPMINDDFWHNLLWYHRDLISGIVDEDFMVRLGITPQTFAMGRGDFSLTLYNLWIKQPELQRRILVLTEWVQNNCYILDPGINGFEKQRGRGNDTGMLGDLGKILSGLSADVEIKGQRFPDLIRVVSLPVLGEQLHSGMGFYIAADSQKLAAINTLLGNKFAESREVLVSIYGQNFRSLI
jgi:hypothetical protein